MREGNERERKKDLLFVGVDVDFPLLTLEIVRVWDRGGLEDGSGLDDDRALMVRIVRRYLCFEGCDGAIELL